MALQVGTKRRARSHLLRVNACGKLQCIVVGFVVLWFAYLSGVIFMAIGVHKLDELGSANPAKDGGGSIQAPPHRIQMKSKVDAHQATPATPTAKPTAKAVVANNTASAAPKPAAVQKPDPEKGKNKPKMRRPGFKPNPHGHMVAPEVFVDLSNVSIIDDKRESGQSTVHQKFVPPQQVLAAYLEPINQSEWDIKPLPRRRTTASDLTKRSFPKLNSCSRLPEQWPVDEYPDEDPFLPWIHDVFPTEDGKFLQFVAQNKRRCHTGTTEEEEEILEHMAPQVALFQHVALKKVPVPPEAGNSPFISADQSNISTTYRLASHEDADPESIATRFICRFKPSGDITFSTFNNDYEWVALRKHQSNMFSSDGRDNKQIQTSQLLFKCPFPEHLVETVKTGNSVQNDWATMFVDLIPIRTPPRYGPPHEFLVPHYREGLPAFMKPHLGSFKADVEWGTEHLLPSLENSGRWENIPICKPSLMTYEPQALASNASVVIDSVKDEDNGNGGDKKEYKHRLVSCLWASAGYATRGNRYAINDGQRRLVEWITFNKLLGFDHFYIYDNSGAFTNDTSLEPVATLFPDDVTIIRWPSQVCNNNPNNVDSIGERSSQYAAESSCRLRFGPHTQWIGQFDIDEYLVPMGNYSNVLQLLDKLDQENTKIISFSSWRAWPRLTHIDEPVEIQDSTLCGRDQPCFELSVKKNVTMLEGYNCDRFKPGQKSKVMPAEKQLYRADYVKQHFIHYSTVTETTNLHFEDYQKKFGKRRLFPDPLSRFGDEVNEGLMLHSKAIARQDTAGWIKNCHSNFTGKGFDQCRLGIPWPEGEDEQTHNRTYNSEGWNYNCFVNRRIDDFWGPQLQERLKERGFL